MRKVLQILRKVPAALGLMLMLVALGIGLELGVGRVGMASAAAASPAPVTPAGTPEPSEPPEPSAQEAQVAQAAQAELSPGLGASADKLRHLISTHFDLRKNDEMNKGRAFTVERHVAKSFESLEISLERQQRNSSWQPQRRIKSSYVSLEIAEEVVKQALLANVDKIQAWLSSDVEVTTGEPTPDKRGKDQQKDQRLVRGQGLGHERDEDRNPNIKSKKDENKSQKVGRGGKGRKKDGQSRRESYLRLKYKMPNKKIGYGIIQSSKDQVPKLLRYESEKAVVVISKEVGTDAALPFFVVTSYPVQK